MLQFFFDKNKKMEENVVLVDTDTGEVLKRRIVKKKLSNVKYVRVTIRAMELSPIHIKTGIFIGTIVESKTNEFRITSDFKKQLKDTLEIKDPRYFQLLAELKKLELIVNVNKTKLYMLNPYYFFRCVARNRIKLEKTYDKLVYRLQYNRELKEEVQGAEFIIPSR